MDTFLLNAQRIFDVARTDSSDEFSEFALLVRRDGGIHMVMNPDADLSLRAAEADVRTSYKVTRTQAGLKVAGTDGAMRCELEDRRAPQFQSILRDQPLYRITSPLLISTTV